MEPLGIIGGFGISLAAFGLAIYEARRNHSTILNIEYVGCSFVHSENENLGQPFVEFRFRIRNLGVSLHNIDAELVFPFEKSDGFRGTMHVKLRRNFDSSADSEFAKGMVGEFCLKSHTLPAETKDMLANSICSSELATSVVIRSQGYIAWSHPIGTRLERVKHLWNLFAGWLEARTLKKVGTNESGFDIVRPRVALARFQTLGPKVIQLRNFLKNETEMCTNE